MFRNKRDFVDSLNISKDLYVLDVGFSGQSVVDSDKDWPHGFLMTKTDHLYGLDLEFDSSKYKAPNYLKASAENFDFPIKFDVIFAADIIEHLSNPGMFLQSCKRNLKPGGRLIITTPNTFNFFCLVEKVTHDEPRTNPDHTLYLNKVVFSILLKKNGFPEPKYNYIFDTTGFMWYGKWKRKLIASIYWLVCKMTPKFGEGLTADITIQG